MQNEIIINEIKGGKKISLVKQKHEFVTSHAARRSFATNEYKKADLEISEIMAITGHKTEGPFINTSGKLRKEQRNVYPKGIEAATIANHLSILKE